MVKKIEFAFFHGPTLNVQPSSCPCPIPYHRESQAGHQAHEKMHRTKAKNIHKETLRRKVVESEKTKTRMVPELAALIMPGLFSIFK